MAEETRTGTSPAMERRNRAGNMIFSQEALDKMRSPERLDTVLPITTPIGWMGLAAVAVMVASVVLWSIFGSFTVKAEGMGLIMDPSGVARISVVSGGKVNDIYVSPGNRVRKGDLIARMEQVQQEAATRMAQYGTEMASSNRDVQGRVHEFASKRYQQENAEYVYSPHDGIVDEMLAKEGDVLGSGAPLVNVRLSDSNTDLVGVLYIPVDKGKRVEMGQTIQLAPNGADISQTGSLLATVRSVSQYPVSSQAIQTTLGNEQLAQWILQSEKSAVMEVTFDLVKNEADPSGFLWTSSVGEHRPITAGSFCTGSIIIERRPPIEKVFYKLSQWLRNR